MQYFGKFLYLLQAEANCVKKQIFYMNIFARAVSKLFFYTGVKYNRISVFIFTIRGRRDEMNMEKKLKLNDY